MEEQTKNGDPLRRAVLFVIRVAGRRAGRGVLAGLLTGLLAVALAAPARAASNTVSATPRHTVGFNGAVRALARTGDTVYVGGTFTQAVRNGTHTTRRYLAAVDAGTGRLLAWAPRVNGAVTAIAVDGGHVYLAGDFTTVDGHQRRHLAEVSAATGALDTGFRHSISTPPYDLAVGAGRLYVVGSFGHVDGRTWHRAAAFRLSTGALDTGFRPRLDGTVRAVAVDSGRVYLGGRFHTVNGSHAHPRLAAVHPWNGATVRSFAGGATYLVHHVAVGPDGVYAAVGGPGGRLVAYTTGGARSWTLTADGDLATVAVLGGVVYGGGHFDHVCTTARVASGNGDCLDGKLRRGKLFAATLSGDLLDWAPQANSVHGVFALAVDRSRGTLLAGGAFTTFHGSVWQPRFARFGPS